MYSLLHISSILSEVASQVFSTSTVNTRRQKPDLPTSLQQCLKIHALNLKGDDKMTEI